MKFFSRFASFFSKVDNSAPGVIVPEELFRSIITAMGSGGLISLLIALLTAVSASAAAIFPNPLTAALATTAIGLVLDLLRRQNQGVKTPGEVVVALSPPIFATMPPGDLIRDPSGNGFNLARQEWQTPRGPHFPDPTLT